MTQISFLSTLTYEKKAVIISYMVNGDNREWGLRSSMSRIRLLRAGKPLKEMNDIGGFYNEYL